MADSVVRGRWSRIGGKKRIEPVAVHLEMGMNEKSGIKHRNADADAVVSRVSQGRFLCRWVAKARVSIATSPGTRR